MARTHPPLTNLHVLRLIVVLLSPSPSPIAIALLSNFNCGQTRSRLSCAVNNAPGYARPMYCPVRVSILTTSPSLMKSGTLTVMPVSNLAGF